MGSHIDIFHLLKIFDFGLMKSIFGAAIFDFGIPKSNIITEHIDFMTRHQETRELIRASNSLPDIDLQLASPNLRQSLEIRS